MPWWPALSFFKNALSEFKARCESKNPEHIWSKFTSCFWQQRPGDRLHQWQKHLYCSLHTQMKSDHSSQKERLKQNPTHIFFKSTSDCIVFLVTTALAVCARGVFLIWTSQCRKQVSTREYSLVIQVTFKWSQVVSPPNSKPLLSIKSNCGQKCNPKDIQRRTNLHYLASGFSSSAFHIFPETGK